MNVVKVVQKWMAQNLKDDFIDPPSAQNLSDRALDFLESASGNLPVSRPLCLTFKLRCMGAYPPIGEGSSLPLHVAVHVDKFLSNFGYSGIYTDIDI